MTYEESVAHEMLLFDRARLQHALLSCTAQEICATVDMDRRIEITKAVNRLREVLFGKEPCATADEQPELPANVLPIRRDLGVRFKRRSVLPPTDLPLPKSPLGGGVGLGIGLGITSPRGEEP